MLLLSALNWYGREACFEGLQVRLCNCTVAGKMQVLEGLLAHVLGGEAGERVVVVSNSTKTLNLVSAVCDSRGWTTVRICGDVNAAKRQDIVTAFNRHNVGQVPVLTPAQLTSLRFAALFACLLFSLCRHSLLVLELIPFLLPVS